MKYYICKTCGNLVEKIVDGGNTPICCGKPMQELSPASTDGAVEKHVPVFEIHERICDGLRLHEVIVKVGESPHPATSIHHIEWIELETTEGVHRKMLKAEDVPAAKFYICTNEKIKTVYAYCNLHGLWEKTCTADQGN